ncbi:hypothetical protein SPFL3102_03547 [Sporomusaceae bacterium FL31]|nr:hypothetical protein SPFL3101_00458 [Sporomusaceae bacterium FL31]GCE35696.1 hypothetical protein SPFL3102_03547 [Sporomusaceae bacterium]
MKRLMMPYVCLLALMCAYVPYKGYAGSTFYGFIGIGRTVSIDYSLLLLQIIALTCVYFTFNYLFQRTIGKQQEYQKDVLKILTLYYALQQEGKPEGVAMIIAQNIYGKDLPEEYTNTLYKYLELTKEQARELAKQDFKWAL